jgi:Uma2 family endonuclease
MSKKNEPNKPDVVKEQQESYLEERYEIIEGIRYDCQPSPRIEHQLLATAIFSRLETACSLNGLIVVAPMDVHLDEDNIVQPDVIFIASENLSIIQDGYIKGTPDLLIEILSPSTGGHDRKRKKNLYERFGIREYWIVDPVYSTVDQFILHDGVYQGPSVLTRSDTLTSPFQPCISMDIQALFATIVRFQNRGQ